MFKKIKNWLSSNKLEVLQVYGITITALLAVVTLWLILFAAMSNDLVEVVDDKNTEIEELAKQKLIIETNFNEIMQQYTDDVEYLESVILELRTQCEQECGKCD